MILSSKQNFSFKKFVSYIWNRTSETIVTDDSAHVKSTWSVQFTRIIWFAFIATSFVLMILNVLPMFNEFLHQATATSTTSSRLDSSSYREMNVCFFIQYFTVNSFFNTTNLLQYSPINHYLATSPQGIIYFAINPELWPSINMFPSTRQSVLNLNTSAKQLLKAANVELAAKSPHFLKYYNYSNLTWYERQPSNLLIKRTNNTLKMRPLDLTFKLCTTLPIDRGLRWFKLEFKLPLRHIYEISQFFSLDAPMMKTSVDFPHNQNLLDGTTSDNVLLAIDLVASPIKYTYSNLRRRPCITVPKLHRQIIDGGADECFTDCITFSFEQKYNCQFLGENIFHVGKRHLCNVHGIFQNIINNANISDALSVEQLLTLPNGFSLGRGKLMHYADSNQTDKLDSLRIVYSSLYRHHIRYQARCSEKCLNYGYCTQWSVGIKQSVEKQDLGNASTSNGDIKVQARFGISLSSMLTESKESLSEPITSFLADAGGVIGLYFSFSLMTILALCSYFLNKCLTWKRMQHVEKVTNTVVDHLSTQQALTQMKAEL